MTAPETDSCIRIMLVEDNAAYREVITLAINDQSDMTMVAEFGTTEGALQHLEALPPDEQPDILLLDLRLPGMNGLEAISHFHGMAAAMRIIVLTQSDTPGDIARAIRKGVSGYLLKRATLPEITHGIRTVASGGASLDSDVARHILTSLQRPASSVAEPLTEREHEVLELLAEGLLKKEISAHLGITYSTVDTHVSRIYEKLQATNAPAAVSEAYRQGILRPGK